MNTTYKKTCAAAPLQFEGEACGGWYYYRFRWGMWRFGIGKRVDDHDQSSDNAVAVAMGFADGFQRKGYWVDEMTDSDAIAIIDNCIQEYQKTRPVELMEGAGI